VARLTSTCSWEIVRDIPAALAWLNRQRGEASMRLANALMDWRDMWAKR